MDVPAAIRYTIHHQQGNFGTVSYQEHSRHTHIKPFQLCLCSTPSLMKHDSRWVDVDIASNMLDLSAALTNVSGKECMC